MTGKKRKKKREESPTRRTHLSESSHQAGLAHTSVPHEHDLEEKFVVLHVLHYPAPGGEGPRRRFALASRPLNKDDASVRTGGRRGVSVFDTNRGTAGLSVRVHLDGGPRECHARCTHTHGPTRALTSSVSLSRVSRKGEREEKREGAERN